MKRTYIYLSLLLLPLSFFQSCYYYGVSESKNPWTYLEISSRYGSYTDMHATESELFLISRNHFYRLGKDENLVEQKELEFPSFFFADEIISDHAFVRFIERNNRQVVQIQPTKNPSISHDLYIDEILVEDGANINIDLLPSFSLGAFNANSTQLAFAVEYNKSGVGRNIGIVIVDIEYNISKDNFQDISVQPVVSVPELRANLGTVSNFRHINGHYYLTHQDGAIRIENNGNYQPIAIGWTLDVFQKSDSTYLSFYNDNNFSVSKNGLSFSETSASKVKFIKEANNQFFNQIGNGFRMQLADEEVRSISNIHYNEQYHLNLQPEAGSYKDIVFFNGKYYICLDDQLYSSGAIETY